MNKRVLSLIILSLLFFLSISLIRFSIPESYLSSSDSSNSVIIPNLDSQILDLEQNLDVSLNFEEEEPDEEEIDDEDDDGINDEREELNERALEIKFDDEKIEIQSESQDNQNQNQISFTIEFNEEYIHIKLVFQNKTTTGEFTSQLEFNIIQILEFLDMTNNSIYDPEIDQLIQTYEFGSFLPPQYQIMNLSTNKTIHHFLLTTINGIFTVHFFFVELFEILNSSLITPAQMKLDFEIKDFPFQNSDSYLALQMEVISEIEWSPVEETEDEENGFADDEQGIILKNSASSGIFSWKNFALVDGSNRSVSATIVHEEEDDENYVKVFFNYPHGSVIYHDPKIGVVGLIRNVPQSPDTFNFFTSVWFYILLGLVLLAGIFGVMLTNEEFRHYLSNRLIQIDSGIHRLTMDDILENEFRRKIIDLVVQNPGIHYSELFRQVGTSESNFAWHLDVLETYKILFKQRIGRFLVFYPYYDENPFSEFDPTIAKSKTTLEIFEIISENPGIYLNKIAIRMDLNRKTIKYHIDKLVTAKLIKIEKLGRILSVFKIDPPDANPSI